MDKPQGEFFHHTVPAVMITFTRAVHFLPIFLAILIVVTILTPYIIAVSLDHVYPFLPCISKTAGFEPEGSISGFFSGVDRTVDDLCSIPSTQGIQSTRF